MRRKCGAPWLAAGVLAVPVVMACAALAAADEFPAPEVSYSADVKLTTSPSEGEGDYVETLGRIWYSDGKRRREVSFDGLDTVVIEREDLGVRWSRLPGTPMYSELPIGRVARGSGPDPAHRWRSDVTLERRGSERVNGVQADRYEVTAKSGHGTAWLTREKVPVRYEGTFRDRGRETRLRMDYTNIQIGPQEGTLFELPEGVKPIPSMPISTHGPGSDRKRVQEDMRKQVEEIRKQAEELHDHEEE